MGANLCLTREPIALTNFIKDILTSTLEDGKPSRIPCGHRNGVCFLLMEEWQQHLKFVSSPIIKTRLCEKPICTLSQKHFALKSCFKKENISRFGIRGFLKLAIQDELTEQFFPIQNYVYKEVNLYCG